MDIKLLNFGPIKEYRFDLSKDLIVTYGKNNIGKSYAMSMVYLLLKYLCKIDIQQLEYGAHKFEFETIFDKLLAPDLNNSIKNTFGGHGAIRNFQTGKIPSLWLNNGDWKIEITFEGVVRGKKYPLREDKSPGSDTFSFPGLLEDIKRQFEKLYFLPASRSGLYTGMSTLTPLIAELSKSRSVLTRKIELPGFTEPIADYILHLSEISTPTPRNEKLEGIADAIEKEILKGEVKFDQNRNQLYYIPQGSRLHLEMNAVSSMVAELSPIVAFMKFILAGNGAGKTKPVIFIEEPEAHLHPEAQVRLAEVFVKLINAGVKLIITSHSNYIFNKLSNMVISGQLDLKQYAPIILKETPDGSISHQMQADDLGVEDENFLDTADKLYEERERILDDLNNRPDDQ